MKDFYYVWVLSEQRRFEGEQLAEAIAATFARRATALPSPEDDAQRDLLDPAFGRAVARAAGALRQVVIRL